MDDQIALGLNSNRMTVGSKLLWCTTEGRVSPLPLKSGQIGILVQIDAQCSKVYEKTICRFLQFKFFEKLSILYTKFLENWPKYRQK